MKRNGFYCPTNISQISTLILFIIKIAIFVILTKKIIFINTDVFVLVIVLFSVLISLTLFIIIIATLTDSSDPYLIMELEKKEKCIKLLRNFFSLCLDYVIEIYCFKNVILNLFL